ncbi:hypothetical protein WICANDRAFT_29623 [Wickerhamomyces anomalus NRRL Y-366-8]|uniref:Uncharacterized protein n=1 Tax=Wickerhamomyces anomalus (strain ATCC 58044 / CBS 1984 / NCYC 433 / NRRL Y-366-8) TaxID=683960 RepID=A0A1E3P3S8_WICAA|nr:uncharacterized protein WICANDRAFT_29623 [Wickerhamomyces anomalus NRRL Y-366-8]ODQ60003.1 hypothetical protein WICANDRAFT_29623 [Wickerhamomyces anomalus NRRL Y-366-8]
MSKSQDYIARIRYQNDLPPPPLPPNLLNYKIPKDEEIGSSSLLSSLYRKENVNNLIKLNDDLGQSIDLIQVPDAFDRSKQDSKLYALSDNIKLHPNDRILLRDPGVDTVVGKQPNVAFLRRTEYIGSSRQNANATVQNSRLGSPQVSQDDNTPATQLRSIESTFTNSTKTLKNLTLLKHPLKKNLKAKKVWSLLPDTSRMDQSFSSIRMLGSASTSNRGTTSTEFHTSIFRPVELEQADWMSFYVTDEESSTSVKRTIDDLSENVPNDEIDENEGSRYKYLKKNDYDMKAIAVEGGIKDIALRFDHKENIAYYNPIQSKAELKRHRLHDSLKELVEQVDYDEVNLKIREPTNAELNSRNSIRHSHDPVNYEAVEVDAE